MLGRAVALEDKVAQEISILRLGRLGLDDCVVEPARPCPRLASGPADCNVCGHLFLLE